MTTLALPARRTGSPAGLVARTLLARTVRISRWFWLCAVAAVVLVTLIWLQFAQPPWSVMSWARQAVLWFSFAQAIVVVTTELPAYVAAGLTRRSFVRGALVAHLVAGLGHAAVLIVLVQLERLVHHALGWQFTITDAVFDPTGRAVGALLTEYAVTFCVAGLSGLLVGAVYLRGRGWWGTLTLPLTVGPVLVFGGFWGVALATGAELAQRLAVTVAVGAGALALMAAAVALIVRGAPMRTTT
jgi:hypothetical protein